LVTDEEYRRLTPPRSVSRLPADLRNPALEYSGIYEDGWVAEHAYVRLSRAPGADFVAIRGVALPAPAGSPPQQLVVSVDGQEVVRQAIDAPFTLRVAAPPGPGRARVDVRVSPLRPLAAPDTRRVGFLLLSVEFQP